VAANLIRIVIVCLCLYCHWICN